MDKSSETVATYPVVVADLRDFADETKRGVSPLSEDCADDLFAVVEYIEHLELIAIDQADAERCSKCRRLDTDGGYEDEGEQLNAHFVCRKCCNA